MLRVSDADGLDIRSAHPAADTWDEASGMKHLGCSIAGGVASKTQLHRRGKLAALERSLRSRWTIRASAATRPTRSSPPTMIRRIEKKACDGSDRRRMRTFCLCLASHGSHPNDDVEREYADRCGPAASENICLQSSTLSIASIKG